MDKPQGKQAGQKTGGDSLLSQKPAEGLVLSDTEHDLAMQVHKYSSQETTANPEGVSYAEMIPSSLGPGYRRETNTRHTPSLSTHLPPTIYTSPTPTPPSQLGSLPVQSHAPALVPHCPPEQTNPLTRWLQRLGVPAGQRGNPFGNWF